MDVRLLWAGVWFTAQIGDAESLLSEAAQAGLHLSAVSPAPGGFSGRCAAWQYRSLAALAQKRRVRLRIQTRTGLYFRLRPARCPSKQPVPCGLLPHHTAGLPALRR